MPKRDKSGKRKSAKSGKKAKNANGPKHSLDAVETTQKSVCCSCCLPTTMSIYGKGGKCNSDDELNEAEQQMQKRTFTNWINLRLEEHSSSGRVNDLFVDMRDGILLKPKKRHFSDDSKRVYYFANLAAALKCLRGNGLHLLSNNVTDLANGNPHVWLGLVWQIILHFQVEKDLTLLRQSAWHQIHQQHLQLGQKCRDNYLSSPSTSNGGFASPTPGGKKEEVERQLIRWINEEVIGDLGLRINDLDRSWCDGRLFSALVHRFAPALMPRGVILGGGNDAKSAQLKTERAMEMARIHLGIRPLLDPRDLSTSEYVPDKRSIVAYISQFARLPQRQINHPEKIVGAQIALERQEKVTSEAEEPLEKVGVFRECLDWLNSVVVDERLTFVQGQRMSLRHYIVPGGIHQSI
uniref:Calponin-homology (CH) domain-containing protein n=1 Tax=Globodera rostochiensis TaxID=31243 RepID=A0A914GRZ8_GLORO